MEEVEVERSVVWPGEVKFHGLSILPVLGRGYRVSILSMMSILSMSMLLCLLLELGSSPQR